MSTLDCVVIGYNDIPYFKLADKHKPLEWYSGKYSTFRSNSVLVDGKRKNYMELLNYCIEHTHGVDPEFNAFELPNLGAIYLTSFLRQRGYDAELVNFYNYGKERLAELLADNPRSVAITTTYYVENEPIEEVVQFIREHNPDTKIIIGGPHIYNIATSNTNDQPTQEIIFRSIGADIYIADSQGEASLARVLACVRNDDEDGLAQLPNLIYLKKNGSVGRTNRVEERNSLETNVVNWDYFKSDFYTPTMYMRTARSCPFQCSFCTYPAMSGEHTLSGIDSIRDELRYLVEGGLKQAIFVDDTFNVPLPRFKQLCKMMIEEKFNLKWFSFFRCSNADDETFDLMKESGCTGVFLGIESGDQQILNNMNKFANLEKYKEGIRKLHERDIFTFAAFIVGFPGETKQSVINTMNFIEESPPTFFSPQLYFHDPITRINHRREEFGIEGSHYRWRHNTMCWEEGAEWLDHMVRTIKNSISLTLYGFSIWAIPYMIQNGFTLDQVKGYGRTAGKMMIKSLDDSAISYEAELAEMRQNFASWTPEMRTRYALANTV